jgi:hypothetical protein
VQTVLARIVPPLREATLSRLVERGDLDSKSKKLLGMINSTRLTLGSGHREELLDPVRAVFCDGADPDTRPAAIVAPLSASGTLSQFNREVP